MSFDLVFLIIIISNCECITTEITTVKLAPELKECAVSISSLNPEPIVIHGRTLQFLYPDRKTGKTHVFSRNDIIISCPGTHLTLQSNNFTTVRATCLSNATFFINNKNIYFYDIRCVKKPISSARETSKKCGYESKEIEIGFQLLPSEVFIPQIQLCFDNLTKTTLYTKYTLSKSIQFREHGVKRPNFIEGRFFSFNQSVNKIYSKKSQKETINNLLGLSQNSTKYIKKTNLFLSRGHLAPKADFIYAPQQLATFYYLNTVPQWQNINGGNWQKLENDIRLFITKSNSEFEIYTGGYGVATLPHEETGEETPLFLYYNQTIPIPAFLWKIVINKSTRKGVVFVSVNNPYSNDLSRENLLCRDILEDVDWLNWKRRSVKDGVVYACLVDEFRKIVTFLPDIQVDGLLSY